MSTKRSFLFLSLVLSLLLASCQIPSSVPSVQNPLGNAPAQPTATLEPTPTPAPKHPITPCDNILYPLIEGQQMVYTIHTEDGEDLQLGMTVSKVEDSVATIDMLNIQSGIVSQTQATCKDGALQDFPLITISTLAGDVVSGDLQYNYVSGLFAPAEVAFDSANWELKWETQYLLRGTLTANPGDEEDATVVTFEDSPVLIKWETVGTGETMTVAAGTYENVIEVKQEMTMEVNVVVNGFNVKSTMIIHSTHWYEPYVGMIKTQMDTASLEYSGMTFPIAVNETIELVEFHPAP